MIVVVGHGRSPEGKGWGPHIEAAGCVVRMWDWHWQAPRDYGQRYDYGVFSILPVSTKAFNTTPKKEPEKGWLGYLRGQLEGDLPPRTEIIGQGFRDKAMEISPAGMRINLTRGCAAACWAVSKKVETVVLVGFDNLQAGLCLPTDEAFSPEYQAHYDQIHPQWRKGWYSPGSTRCGSHNIAVERVLLQELASENNVNLQFAGDIW